MVVEIGAPGMTGGSLAAGAGPNHPGGLEPPPDIPLRGSPIVAPEVVTETSRTQASPGNPLESPAQDQDPKWLSEDSTAGASEVNLFFTMHLFSNTAIILKSISFFP